MGYSLGLLLLALAALVTAVVRSPRPHPRHEFVFGLVARLAPGDVAQHVTLNSNWGEKKTA